MKKHTPLFLVIFLFSATVSAQVLSPLVNVAWIDTTGHPSLTFNFQAGTKDASGNFIQIGNTYNDGGGIDLLITKYNSSGTRLWQNAYHDTIINANIGVDVYCWGGYIYVCGTDYDSTTQSSKLLISKLRGSDGHVNWSETYQNSYGGYDIAGALKVDNSGNVFVVGTDQFSSTGFQIVLVKYDSTGTQKWIATYDSSGFYNGGVALKVNTGPSGNQVSVTGFGGTGFSSWNFITAFFAMSTGSRTSVSFSSNGNGSFSSPAGIEKDAVGRTYVAGTATRSGTNTDIKVLQYDTNFVQKWVVTWGNVDSLADSASRMTMDYAGNLLITGFTTASNGARQMLTLKYNEKDSLLWSRTVSAPNVANNCTGQDITSDDSSNVYVVGKVYNGSNYDFITVAYDQNGNFLWQEVYDGGPNTDNEGKNIVVDTLQNVYVSGTTVTDSGKSYYTTIMYEQQHAYLPVDSIDSTGAYAFYINQGQLWSKDTMRSADSVFFYTRASNPELFIGDKRISYVFARSNDTIANADTLFRVDVSLVNPVSTSYTQKNIYPTSQTNPYLNYFLTYLPQSAVRVKGYDRLVEKDVYKGIDWQLCATKKGWIHSFIVSPLASTTPIELSYKNGSDSISIVNHALTIYTPYGTARDTITAYTVDSVGNKTAVTVSYDSLGVKKYGVSLGSYNSNHYLIIESSMFTKASANRSLDNLEWSTYMGGTGYDEAVGMDIDASGDVFITGWTSSEDFPTTVGLPVYGRGANVFVSEFTPVDDGTTHDTLVWSTYYGGVPDDSFAQYGSAPSRVRAIAVGSVDRFEPLDQPLYITGNTISKIPTPIGIYTSGYHQNSYQGGASDIMFARFNAASGYLTYATYLGGAGYDNAFGLAVNRTTNDVFVGGLTEDSTFPRYHGYSGNFHSDTGWAVLVEFNNAMNLVWSTGFGSTKFMSPTYDKYGASIQDLKFDPSGNLLIAGYSPSAFSYSVTLPTGAYTQGHRCTASGTYGLTSNAFIAKFTPSGPTDSLKYNLYYYSEFGGTDENAAYAIASDNNNNMYLGGVTYGVFESGGSHLYPFKTPGGSAFMDSSFTGYSSSSSQCGFMAEFSSTGALGWSTLIKGNGSSAPYFTQVAKVVCDDENNSYFFGSTTGSTGFPLDTRTGFYYDNELLTGETKSFITSFSSGFAENWGTFFGGNNLTLPGGEAVYGASLYIDGVTYSDQTSTDPLQVYPLRFSGADYIDQTFLNEKAFIARLNINGLATGTTEVEKDEAKVTLFPNPNNGNFTLLFNEGLSGKKEIMIMSEMGQVIQSRSTSDDRVQISSTNLASGIYFVRVATTDRSIGLKFIVVK